MAFGKSADMDLAPAQTASPRAGAWPSRDVATATDPQLPGGPRREKRGGYTSVQTKRVSRSVRGVRHGREGQERRPRGCPSPRRPADPLLRPRAARVFVPLRLCPAPLEDRSQGHWLLRLPSAQHRARLSSACGFFRPMSFHRSQSTGAVTATEPRFLTVCH